MPGSRRLSPLLGIFLTVFFDLLSFGIFIPDLQLRGRELATKALGVSASPEQIGLLTGITLAVFSLAQLLTSPYLGRLSDCAGRRKVLLVTTALSVISYLVYAHATSIWIVVIARVVSGIAAANLGVAFAYVADVTAPEERAKGMGMIGAAFGLGFVLGPAIGGYLLYISHNSPLALGYTGAGFAFVNLLYVWLILPESKPAHHEESHFLADLKTAVSTPGLGLMLAMFFTLNLGFTNLETTFFQLLADPWWIYKLGDSARQSGSIILLCVGVVTVIMQGGVVRAVTPKFGELKLLRFAYLMYVPVFAMVPFLPLWIPMILGVVAMGICSGLSQPNLSSLISRSAPKSMQGGVFGVTQGLGAIARFVGPLISNPLFAMKPYAPYALGAFLIMIPAIASWRLKLPELDAN